MVYGPRKRRKQRREMIGALPRLRRRLRLQFPARTMLEIGELEKRKEGERERNGRRCSRWKAVKGTGGHCIERRPGFPRLRWSPRRRSPCQRRSASRPSIGKRSRPWFRHLLGQRLGRSSGPGRVWSY